MDSEISVNETSISGNNNRCSTLGYLVEQRLDGMYWYICLGSFNKIHNLSTIVQG